MPLSFSLSLSLFLIQFSCLLLEFSNRSISCLDNLVTLDGERRGQLQLQTRTGAYLLLGANKRTPDEGAYLLYFVTNLWIWQQTLLLLHINRPVYAMNERFVVIDIGNLSSIQSSLPGPSIILIGLWTCHICTVLCYPLHSRSNRYHPYGTIWAVLTRETAENTPTKTKKRGGNPLPLDSLSWPPCLPEFGRILLLSCA